MKRLISIFLCAVILLCNLPITVFAEGDTILITSAADLVALSKSCSLDTYSAGKTVVLKNDIDLKNTDFTPIPYFAGHFDGDGHTISGFKLNGNGSYQGLFRYTAQSAYIENLTVTGTVTPNGTKSCVGGIVGENSGTLSKCTFEGTVSGTEKIGGIAGSNTDSGIISDCTFSGDVTGEHEIGGIAGENSGTVMHCENKGNINTVEVKSTETRTFDISALSEEEFLDITDIGGIAGYSVGIIESCVNSGSVGYEHIGYNVGGIVGRQTGYTSGCENTGSVVGRKDTGGITGQLEPYTEWDFSKSKLTELQSELEELDRLVNIAIEHSKSSSEQWAENLKQLEQDIQSVTADIDDITAQISDDIQTSAEAVGELFGLIDEALNSYDVTEIENLLYQAETLLSDIGESIDTAQIVGDIQKLINDIPQISEEELNARISEIENEISDIWENAPEITSSILSELETAISNTDWAEVSRLIVELQSSISGEMERIDIHELFDLLYQVLEKGMEFLDSDTVHRIQDILSRISVSAPDFQNVSDDIDHIVSMVGILKSSLSDDSAVLSEDIENILIQLDRVTERFFTTAEDIADVRLDQQSDISADDENFSKNASVFNCKNHAEITADTNVGGIVGCVSFEIGFDMEDELNLSDYLLTDARFLIFASVRKCESYDNVTAVKGCAGGIAGNMDFGAVTDCLAAGTIAVDNGDYCGGIVGKTSGTVVSSYSRTELCGEKYVGGIAGYGGSIRDCLAYSYIESADEYFGSVAGFSEDTLDNNFYVENGIGAVDNISYTGKAEPLSYEEMLNRENVPDIFGSIIVTFIYDDGVVSEVEVPFGGSITELPEVENDGTKYWKWDDFDKEHIYYSMTVHGEYVNPKTTISSNEEPPLFLVEGTFYEGQKLTAAEQEPQEGVVSSYQLSVNDYDGRLTVRYRYASNGDLYIFAESGKAVKQEYEIDGSYIVFEMDNDSIFMIKESDEKHFPVIAICASAVVGVMIILIVIYKRNIRKKANKGESNESKEDQNNC